ncbi:hypothetical protein FIBSPDRAFT_753265 [Athelia psychrophila]|uniref:Uncharacterized protein n=1 Tax=Athelia psychrophila TaxID=1759441 RepID=A0A166CDZ3_9AGAM|nr:hypothetical protein FIBSPDRAFT_753265 [Fibularhizoctonia sp. CBS 109695]
MRSAPTDPTPSRAPSAPTKGAAASARKPYRKKKEKDRKTAKKALLRRSSSQGAVLCNPTAVARNLKDLLAHQTGFITAGMPHTAPGYQGRSTKGAVKRVYALEELVGEGSKFGFDLKRWDGISPIPLLDDVARIIGVCSGRPRATDWGNVTRSASSAIAAARAQLNFPDGSTDHRRGQFPAMAIGVSYGGGQQVPGNLVHSNNNRAVLEGLLQDPSICRIASFANGSFALWSPRVHQYYHQRLERLYARYPLLRRNFERSVFPAATFNFGPTTCCFPHVDPGNLPFGMCAITALGDFDPKLGGHIVLWDLKLVIEFPPGATILITSASVKHSNVGIQDGETRYSFTQYAAGGLFRWVDHGFQPEKVYKLKWSAQRKREEVEIGRRRWQEGIKLFSTVNEVRGLNRASLPPLVVPN